MHNWLLENDHSETVISAGRHINSKHGININTKLRENAVVFELGYAMKFISKNYDIEEEIVKLPCFLNQQNCLHVKGKNNVSFIQGSYGAPAAVDLLETIIALGVKKVLVVGFCGGISEKVNTGDLIITEEVIREEGTSFHYLPPTYTCTPEFSYALMLKSISKKRIIRTFTMGKQ